VSLLYSIGEVSRMTGVSVKALRLYQEKGLIAPARIDEASGYRYYAEREVERARAIRVLRDLRFSLEEIRAVLDNLDEGPSLASALAQVRARLVQDIEGAQRALTAVEVLLRHDEQAQAYLRAPPPVVVRESPGKRIATIRARGQYADASRHFPRLFALAGRFAAGPPFCLFHEAEYREADADISWCLPVSEAIEPPDDLTLETLPAIRAATVVHTGPWDSVGLSWTRLFAHLRAEGAEPTPPLRETYLRGPEAGDPSLYVTELALPMAE
jgi:DNA-binding transcriptional MerR regulator